MINFREIFNQKNNIIGLIIIMILIVLIILINKDMKTSMKSIGKSIFISGLITIVISFLIKRISNLIIPDEYLIFTNVILKNVTKNIIVYSLVCLLIGLILIILTFIHNKKGIGKNS